ncbi:hypothetical protein LB543_27000 [Mesorhizobium sp. ESP7-2]|uniref:hypothetical protein n=1 Tax=Mesorhizobium sp. ESP7-2 TaxID=2876622 RepID=UPI001CCCED36|nr:hypothetical protein [Mesorhizobium sp. ESP7-2]MBZ9710353.1 hypothetical protein [Mesorhizobium sp. ESP7-2]
MPVLPLSFTAHRSPLTAMASLATEHSNINGEITTFALATTSSELMNAATKLETAASMKKADEAMLRNIT